METRDYIEWAMDVNRQLAARATEREEERQARHAAHTHTANIIDGLRLQVGDLEDQLDSTNSKVRTLQDIAASIDALLKGVMGRSGMVAQVGEHESRLSRMEVLMQQVVSNSKTAGEVLDSQSVDIKWMQRIIFFGLGGLMLLQFFGLDTLKEMFHRS